ncbi:Uncharacterised protein r2_g237 [Pycnogonum litorale]
MEEQGGAEADIRNRIRKARTAFNILRNIWKSKSIQLKTKLKIFMTNVQAVLLYGSETWKMTAAIEQKLQAFIDGCLRRILGIWWPKRITNEELNRSETSGTAYQDQEVEMDWSYTAEREGKTGQGRFGHGIHKVKEVEPAPWGRTWKRTTEEEMKRNKYTPGDSCRPLRETESGGMS